MNYKLFIARRLISGHIERGRLSGPVIRVAVAGIAIGMAVMTVSVAVGLGFKRQIRQKVAGFGSHIQVMSFDYNQSYETNPIEADSGIVAAIGATPGVTHTQVFISKPGLVKTDEGMHGLALKGIGTDFDTAFVSSIMEEGHCVRTWLPDSVPSDDIVVSRRLATMLGLKPGDAVRTYFLHDGSIRARRFRLAGIFNSHFAEFDESIAYADIRQLRGLNGWTDRMVSGIEIEIDDFGRIDDITSDIAYLTAGVTGADKKLMRTRNIMELQPQIFSWLGLLDTNIAVILALILAVAGLNMISGLLILILENTNMIGLLKAMGSRSGAIRSIFVYIAVYIIGKGLVIGNVIGIALCMAQSRWGIVRLDADNYYLDTVPIHLTPLMVLALNAGTVLLTTLMIVGPSYVIAKIKPAKAIRFN